MGQLTLFDLDFDRLPLGPFDTPWWWLLIGISVILLVTLQGLETAVEGTWPHQRRDNEYIPGVRGVKPAWAFAAILIIPGALAMIGIVAVIIWLDIDAPEGLNLGGALLALGWLLFLIFGLNLLGLGRVLGTLGAFGPIAIGIVLLVADGLLIVTLMDVLPSWDVVEESLRRGLEDMLPFLDFEEDQARSLRRFTRN
jgi:hypothetical protein